MIFNATDSPVLSDTRAGSATSFATGVAGDVAA
jgi:hypothetical protein